MSKFVKALENESNWTLTENGAHALLSTNNNLVDLFGIIGSMRSRSEDEIIQKFILAFHEDRLLATKMAFYARSIREIGLGERQTSAIIFKYMADQYPDIMSKNMALIPSFGTFQDWYAFVNTKVEDKMWEEMRKTFYSDIKNMFLNNPISLLAKWMKSTNTSSKESVKLGRLTAKKMGMDERNYRKTLSKMRNYIDVVESKMSSNRWDEIDFSKVPSKAMKNYRSAFLRHTPDSFEDYLEMVEGGKAKINSSTLFPYDITEEYLYKLRGVDRTLEAQWNSLPNYIDNGSNIMVMADVSGSMRGRPMATSIGLAIYFAERCKGDFHNKFMTFSSNPKFVEIKGNNLYEKIHSVHSAEWGMSTDLSKAFKLVLDAAINNNVPAEDMPKAIVVISD